MANSYSDWQAFPLANSPGDPDPDKPYLQAALKAAKGPDPDPDAPYLKAAQSPPPQYIGNATTFADPGDLQRYQAAKAAGKSENYALSVGDNGIGAPSLGGVSTPNSYGVAVPTNVLIKQFGNNPAAWRTARAEVNYNGQIVRVPIVDIGPGKRPQSQGVITDMTYPLSQGLGTGGGAKVGLNLMANAGADYTKDKNAWYEEQGRIAQQFQKRGQIAQVGSTPAPTPTRKLTMQELIASSEAMARKVFPSVVEPQT